MLDSANDAVIWRGPRKNSMNERGGEGEVRGR